ncbi:DUF1311 domain-containing protein [Massilia violaceinigra]|uniref:DUF1311 domain-containing protein n=1 Tax=Massilia violaceinigra TaxID=2045208 RepID=A0ABY4ABM5_9BURK|nr:lysozyme inhibitor LprI family protein [Massilia violaceinigra]UOD32146.1 DUF1311 domain-containing protein [Massilia violaceinigra]
MKRVLVLIVMMGSIHAGAAVPYNAEMIAAIAKKANSTKAEVIASIETGCDSGVTPYMRQCSWYHAIAADVKLNTVYQQLLRKLHGTRGKKRLQNAQRAWLAFRDSNCAFDASSWEGGTGHGIIASGCEASMTEQRTSELEKYLSCDNTGCPGSD